MKKNIIQQQGAISIFLAVLLLSELLVIGLGVSFLTVQQMEMSRQVGQSVIAYYAAEAGAEECLYEVRKGTGSCPAAGSLDNGANYATTYNGSDTITSIGHFKVTNRIVELTW